MPSRHLQMIAHGLILVAFMLGLIAAALWYRADSVEPRAQAAAATAAGAEGGGIPDTARQRLIQIEQLESLNKRLTEIERGLRDGSYSIRVIEGKGSAKPEGSDQAKER
jgi:hypothetical protein